MATYIQSTPGIYKITSITSGKIYIGCASIATGSIYSSLAEVCELLNITKGALSRKLLGKRMNNTTFKYI
jgi:hypothetical protein